MPKKSTIQIDVLLDDDKVPENISWKATDTTADHVNSANAMLISFWDNAEKSALRIDLWTKKMMIDEMADFFYQTMTGMAETFYRATKDEALAAELKKSAESFLKNFRSKQKPASELNK